MVFELLIDGYRKMGSFDEAVDVFLCMKVSNLDIVCDVVMLC